MAYEYRKFYIDGQWVDPTQPKEFKVINPATEEVAGVISMGNAADVDRARIVWARDLGPDENQKLLRYYPDRTAWLLEPDAHPPRLTPYPR